MGVDPQRDFFFDILIFPERFITFYFDSLLSSVSHEKTHCPNDNGQYAPICYANIYLISLLTCLSYLRVGVALVLCQSDPVLHDGQSGGDESRRAVIDGVRRRFIEKVVTDHEDNDDGSSSD